MNLDKYLEIYAPNCHKLGIDYQVRKNKIWILCDDCSIYIWDKTKQSLSLNYAFESASTNRYQPKFFVDPFGESCLVFSFAGNLFSFIPDEANISKIQFPSSYQITCGCWVRDGNNYVCILCTNYGEIFSYDRNSVSSCSMIYAFPSQIRIKEINILALVPQSNDDPEAPAYQITETGISSYKKTTTSPDFPELNFVFLLIDDDTVITFFGKEDVTILISHGPSSQKFMLGKVTNSVLKRFHSNIVNGFPTLTAIFSDELGLVMFCAQQKGTKVAFSQNFIDVPTVGAVSIQAIPYGVFLIHAKQIDFIPLWQKTKAQAVITKIPDAIILGCDSDRFWYFTNSLMFGLKHPILQEEMAKNALEKGDYEVADELSIDPDTKRTAILSRVRSLSDEEAGKFLISKNWTLQNIAEEFPNSQILLYAILDTLVFLKNHHEENPKDKKINTLLSEYTNWAFLLFTSTRPVKEDYLIKFIKDYNSYLSVESCRKRLEKLGLYNILEQFLIITHNYLSLADFYISSSNITKALEQLALYKIHTKHSINEYLLRIAKLNAESKKAVSLFIISHKDNFTNNEILPLLIQLPDIASDCISQFSKGVGATLLTISLAVSGDEEKLSKMMLNGVVTPEFSLRVALQYKRHTAAARIQMAMNKIDDAINTLVEGQKSLKEIFEMVDILQRNKDHYKEAFEALLKRGDKLKEGDKSVVISRIMKEKLFPFEKILPYMNNDEDLGLFENQIVEAAQTIKNQSAVRRFRARFPAVSHVTYSIKLSDSCGECGEGLFGEEIIIFPCGHAFHKKCVEKCWKQMLENSPWESQRDLTESCPACGFLGVASIGEPYFVSKE